MCGVAEAGLALSALSAVTSMAGTNNMAKAQQAELARQANQEQVSQLVREDDRHRRMQALIEESQTIYGSNGLTLDGVGFAHAGTIAKDFAYETYNDKMNTDNEVASLQAESKVAGIKAKNKNLETLFGFGEDALVYADG